MRITIILTSERNPLDHSCDKHLCSVVLTNWLFKHIHKPNPKEGFFGPLSPTNCRFKYNRILLCFLFKCLLTGMPAYLLVCMCPEHAGTRGGQRRAYTLLPWTWVTNACEPSDVDAENWTQVLCKSSKRSEPLSHLCNPSTKNPTHTKRKHLHSHSTESQANPSRPFYMYLFHL